MSTISFFSHSIFGGILPQKWISTSRIENLSLKTYLEKDQWTEVKKKFRYQSLTKEEFNEAVQSCQNQLFTLCDYVEKELPLEKLEDFADISAEKFITNYASLLPEDPLFLPQKPLMKEAVKTASAIKNFFPRFFNTYLEIFHLLETGNGLESIWNCAATLEIYYKILALPIIIFKIVTIWLQATTSALFVTLGISLAIGALLYIYVKWLRPCPEELLHCTNLTLEYKKGNIDTLTGRGTELKELIRLIGKKDTSLPNTLIAGPPGVGKTYLTAALAKALVEKKTLFHIHSPKLIENFGSTAHNFIRIFSRVKNFQEKVIFIFDDLHEAIENPDFYSAFKKLIENKGLQIIGITTDEGAKKMEKNDEFMRRFNYTFKLKDACKDQAEAILYSEILKESYQEKPHPIVVDASGIEEILNQSKREEGINIDKAVKILRQSMAQLEYEHHELFPKELNKEFTSLEHDKLKNLYTLPGSFETESLLRKIKDKEQILERKKQDFLKEKKILDLFNILQKQKQQIEKIIRETFFQLKINPNSSLKKKLIFHCCFSLPSIKEKIKQVPVHELSISYRIDRTFVLKTLQHPLEEEALEA